MSTKKAALISGGGSWGAFGGGTLARINKDYDIIVGISTGSLLAPLAALKEWDVLKFGYTSVNNQSIFDTSWYKRSPISRNGKIRAIPVMLTLLFGHKTVRTSNALRKTIDKFFTENYFDALRMQDKEVLVGAQNYAQVPSKIHYFSSQHETYEDFKDWMWCSANFPFFTSLVKKSWNSETGDFHVGLWGDGGLSDLVGIDQLIGKGYKEVDIILHRTKTIDVFEGKKINGLLENVATNIGIMRYDIEFEQFYDKIRSLNQEGTKVTIYWLPRKLSSSSIVFDEEEMSNWWDEGYNTAFDSNRVEVFEPSTMKQ